ncbi:MAG TPA: hypothetical protein DGG95_15185, partial [Cytophagales bacterium]|nr:hypothetical protein [Cytophagales bacterium]
MDWYENLLRPKKTTSIENEIKKANALLIQAKTTNNKLEEVKALIELGAGKLAQATEYGNALDYLIRSLAIEDSLGLQKEKIFTLLTMARVFEAVGDYFKSLEFLNQAQQLSDQEKNRYVQTLILNESGRVKTLHGKEEAAFEDYELALEYARELKQQGLEADALIHLGQLLTRKKKNTEALENFKTALAIYRSVNDKMNEAIALNEVGEMYRLMKNHERALANHVAAIEIRQRLKDDAGLAQSYNNAGALYFDENNFKRAIANLQLALQSAQKSQAQNELLKSYDYLSQCYRELKDFKKALEYRESFLQIEDLISNEKNERELLESQNRYVIQKQETKIDQLEVDREQREKVIEAQKKTRNILVLLIAFGFIIGLLVLYLYFLKRKSARKLAELNATKDKLFSIIGHDLKGPLNSLTSFSSLLLNHIDQISKEEIKMLSQDIDKSL